MVKPTISKIDITVRDQAGCIADVWRTANSRMYHKHYAWISPASFHRLQKAQAALVKKMFGRAR